MEGATGGKKPLKRGTPEYTAYMRSLGRKGGLATLTKHPGHLQDIAASGGRAARTKTPREEPVAPAPAPPPPATTLALDALDAILEELG